MTVNLFPSQPKPKAYSYLRFSTPEQSKGDSHRRQTALAREYALRYGLDLDEELSFHDAGVSAYKGLNSEVGRLADFKAAVTLGKVPPGSFLLVEGLDRLSRLVPRKALRVLEDIVELGVTVVTLTDGKAYTAESLDADPVSLLVAVVTFMRANEESATKGKRVAAAWANKRERLAAGSTEKYSGQLPFWLASRTEPIPDRVQLLRRIYESYREGAGTETIARRLNGEGISSPKGGRWNASTIKKLLDHPSVVGALNSVHGAIEGVFPAVLEPSLVQAVRQMRASTVKGRRGGLETHPFAGLLKCSACGGTIIRTDKSGAKGRWTYLCCANAKVGHSCRYRGWPYEDALKLLRENFFAIADAADTVDNVPEVASVSGGIDALEDAVTEAYETYRQNRTSKKALEGWRGLESELRGERDKLKALLQANELPGRQASEQALQVLRASATNAALRTLFVGGVADMHQRTMTLRLHGGREVALERFEAFDALEAL